MKFMNNCLIGYSGLIGSTLLKDWEFKYIYRKSNINEIRNKAFDNVICAGAPAEKWRANLNPEEDIKNIKFLIRNLSTIKANQFILISTVDVFNSPINVNERSKIVKNSKNAYGNNRRELELFCIKNFENHLIIRLPGLVGPNLKKNALYDIKFQNNINKIDSRNIYQFYPLKNLYKDIEKSLFIGEKIIHLTSEPISIHEIYNEIIKKNFTNHVLENPIKYDFKSKYAKYFNGLKNYQYCKNYIFECISEYLK